MTQRLPQHFSTLIPRLSCDKALAALRLAAAWRSGRRGRRGGLPTRDNERAAQVRKRLAAIVVGTATWLQAGDTRHRLAAVTLGHSAERQTRQTGDRLAAIALLAAAGRRRAPRALQLSIDRLALRLPSNRTFPQAGKVHDDRQKEGVFHGRSNSPGLKFGVEW